MKQVWFWMIVLASVACSQAPLAQSTQEGDQKSGEEVVSLDELQKDEETQAKLAAPGSPKIKVELVHEETGEKKFFDAEVQITPGERYIVKKFDPNLQVNGESLKISDEQMRDVPVALDKVTLIEYWSADNLKENRFWSQMREVERKYAGRDDIQILSVNYDLVLAGRDQVETTKEMLANYSQPARILYDFQDSFRGELDVFGGNCYYLIDHRKQLTHLGRGDVPATQKLFDAIDNALIFQREARKGPVTVTNVKSLEEN